MGIKEYSNKLGPYFENQKSVEILSRNINIFSGLLYYFLLII